MKAPRFQLRRVWNQKWWLTHSHVWLEHRIESLHVNSYLSRYLKIKSPLVITALKSREFSTWPSSLQPRPSVIGWTLSSGSSPPFLYYLSPRSRTKWSHLQTCRHSNFPISSKLLENMMLSNERGKSEWEVIQSRIQGLLVGTWPKKQSPQGPLLPASRRPHPVLCYRSDDQKHA